MISRKELESLAKTIGFNVYQAEKDYLQHAFLAALYSVSTNEFVFKGGTALQKAYGLDRFSEDVDFTFAASSDPADLLEKAAAELGKFAETALGKRERKATSLSLRLKVKGPLYDGTERSTQTIVVEVSLREALLKKAAAKRIVPLYPDLRPYVALCMDLQEVLAEKVRAIMTRDRPRDVYDAWFLLKKGTPFNASEADKKLAYYGKRFELAEFNKAVQRKEKIWLPELKALIRNPPRFEEVYQEILPYFENKSASR
ncbi:MAG: nucleotidyl transferase AbiEii/AbiGii toxin family protein [Candidatus Micrarchaeota archaeon]